MEALVNERRSKTAGGSLHHAWPPYCRVDVNAPDRDEERRAKTSLRKIRFRKDGGVQRRSSKPIFVNRDVELFVRGGGRHSRQEEEDGGQGITVHRERNTRGTQRAAGGQEERRGGPG